MDVQLFHTINDWAGKNHLLDQFMILCSKWGIYLFIFLILGAILNTKSQRLGIYGGISLVMALLISRVLKYTIDRERPFLTEQVHLLFEKSASPSFPSDQGAICGVFIATFWLIAPKWRWLTITLAMLVAISRVFVGHHYPTDVITGLVIGIICFVVVQRLPFWKKTA